jgi:hypothetical protein
LATAGELLQDGDTRKYAFERVKQGLHVIFARAVKLELITCVQMELSELLELRDVADVSGFMELKSAFAGGDEQVSGSAHSAEDEGGEGGAVAKFRLDDGGDFTHAMSVSNTRAAELPNSVNATIARRITVATAAAVGFCVEVQSGT